MSVGKADFMRTFFLITTAVLAAAPAFAQEPVGCDKFRWQLDRERATLTGTDLPKVASGSEAKWPLPFATMVALVPLVDAKLPIAQGWIVYAAFGGLVCLLLWRVATQR